MTAVDATRDRRRPPPGPAAQAFTVAGGLAAWGVALLTAYPMVQVACAAGLPIIVHLVRWVGIVVAVAATLVGYRVYRAAGTAGDGEGDKPVERVQRLRFVGFGGLLLSASGTMLLVVEDLATWVIDPCL